MAPDKISAAEADLNAQARRIHREAIVIDAVCPMARYRNSFEKWMAGGATAIGVTADYRGEFLGATVHRLGAWFKKIRSHVDKLIQVLTVGDIYRAKEAGKLGMIFHFQDTLPFEMDIDSIEVYHRLGLRMAVLAYNAKNLVGDGCSERTDSGLSEFGLRVVAELNRLGIVVDCSHTGYRTTMDAVEASSDPVIISHSNAMAVHPSRRNLKDDQIKAIAGNGGVIGLTGWPPCVSSKAKPSLDDLLNHADYIAKLAGVEHLSLGIDYWEFMAGMCDEERARARYEEQVQEGKWSTRDYPPPPYYFPEGIETPEKLPNLTAGLLRRGYGEEEIKEILGLNLIRVFKKVWGKKEL